MNVSIFIASKRKRYFGRISYPLRNTVQRKSEMEREKDGVRETEREREGVAAISLVNKFY